MGWDLALWRRDRGRGAEDGSGGAESRVLRERLGPVDAGTLTTGGTSGGSGCWRRHCVLRGDGC